MKLCVACFLCLGLLLLECPLSLAQKPAPAHPQQPPELVLKTAHFGPVNSVAFSPDGKLLASGSDDTTVKLWNVATHKALRTLKAGNSSIVEAVAFSPNGKFVAAGEVEQVVLWDVATGRLLWRHKDSGIILRSIAFSPDGSTIATYGVRPELLNAATGQEQEFPSPKPTATRQIMPSTHIKTALDLQSEPPLLRYARIGLGGTTGDTASGGVVAFGPDGSTLAYSANVHTKPQITLLALRSHLARSLSLENYITSVGFSPNGKILATIQGNGVLSFWDTGSNQKVYSSSEDWCFSFAFSPNSMSYATGSRDGTIRIQDTSSHKVMRTLQGHPDYTSGGSNYTSVVFSPDGRLLASGSGDRTIKVWHAASGAEICSLSGLSGTEDKEMLASLWYRKAASEENEADTIADIQQAIRLSPGNSDYKAHLADEYRSQGYSLSNGKSYQEALLRYQSAYGIDKDIQPKKAAVDLNQIGNCYDGLLRRNEAIAFYQRALALNRQLKNRSDEAINLDNIGGEYNSLSQYQTGISYYKLELPILRELADKGGEADALVHIGVAYNGLAQYEKAIEVLNQALAINKDQDDKKRQADALNFLGLAYEGLNRYGEALADFQQALTLAKDNNDPSVEAWATGNIGLMYLYLGEVEKAIPYFRQAFDLAVAQKDKATAGIQLNNIGYSYAQLKQYARAVPYYQQALTMDRERKDSLDEAIDLDNMGMAYQGLGRHQEAIALLTEALTLDRKIGNHEHEANALYKLGLVYSSIRAYDRACDCFVPSLAILRSLNEPMREANTLTGLMLAWQAQKKPGLAIFYGKQAVNKYQQVRNGIKSLDKDMQQGFTASKQDAYRTLADLLIGQGRLPEAQQVLGLLKEEEFFEFVRRDVKASAAVSGTADMTPTEADWESRYGAISDQLITLGREDAELSAIPKSQRKPDQMKRLAALDTDLEAAQHHFNQFLRDLAAHFDDRQVAEKEITSIKETQAMMGDLKALGPGTVMLYTLVGKDNYRVILMTADARKAAQADPPISAAELNKKILAFRETLQDPWADPRPQAQELYKILIGPIEKDLAQAGAKTLMWSLDGDLRYLPVAALYDGKQYLVETYRNTLFTPASEAHLKDNPQTTWTGLGLGVSQPHTVTDAVSNEKLDFNSLPAVPAELSGIIQDSGGATKGGILPGKVLLDSAFQWATMHDALREHYPVVHIASHFRFRAGDDDRSFLLLGDGSPLSLAKIEDETNLFEGVDLLTLSACNTGMGDTGADGREVDGLGILAQRQGAKAIVATLWPVADASTRLLMEQFYQIRQSHPGLSKAEAMQEAQLSLLHGQVRGTAADRNRATEEVTPHGHTTDAPAFAPDPQAPYAHPYYWAPFILIGNWK